MILAFYVTERNTKHTQILYIQYFKEKLDCNEKYCLNFTNKLHSTHTKYLRSGCQHTPPLPGPVLVVQVLVPGDPPPPDPEPGDHGAGHQDPPDGVRLQLLVCKRAPDLQALKTQRAAPSAENDSR